MALPPWLHSLPKAARLFHPIALKGISEGLSANSIINAYKVAGPGIRRTLGLEIIRVARDIEKKASTFSSLKKAAYPNVSKIPISETKMGRDYAYHIKWEAVTESGKTVLGDITVSTWNIISREEAEAMAAAFLDSQPAKYGIEHIEKIQLAGIKKSTILGQR